MWVAQERLVVFLPSKSFLFFFFHQCLPNTFRRNSWERTGVNKSEAKRLFRVLGSRCPGTCPQFLIGRPESPTVNSWPKKKGKKWTGMEWRRLWVTWGTLYWMKGWKGWMNGGGEGRFYTRVAISPEKNISSTEPYAQIRCNKRLTHSFVFPRTPPPPPSTTWIWKLNIVIYNNSDIGTQRPCYIPAVAFIVDGGTGVTGPGESRGLGNRGHAGGEARHSPHPIVRSGITRLVIVSSCLMSLADSGHVSGKKRGELGTVKSGRMRGWFAREMKWT